MLKNRASGGDITKPLSAHEYLICSAQASSHSQFKEVKELMFLRDTLLFFTGAVTAIITNPLWLVRVRMFASRADTPTAYRGLWGVSCFFVH
jgi:solute carrier family 25 (mitochondrial folate transporter), member 32